MRTRLAFFSIVFPALLFVGCSAADDGTESSEADLSAAGCVSVESARQTYDREVKAALGKVEASFAASKETFDRTAAAAFAKHQYEVAAAFAELQAIVETATDEAYDYAVADYNAKVGKDGPIVRAYNERVAAAQAQYGAETVAATKTYGAETDAAHEKYDATICR